jgi:hypothetical protein
MKDEGGRMKGFKGPSFFIGHFPFLIFHLFVLVRVMRVDRIWLPRKAIHAHHKNEHEHTDLLIQMENEKWKMTNDK